MDIQIYRETLQVSRGGSKQGDCPPSLSPYPAKSSFHPICSPLPMAQILCIPNCGPFSSQYGNVLKSINIIETVHGKQYCQLAIQIYWVYIKCMLNVYANCITHYCGTYVRCTCMPGSVYTSVCLYKLCIFHIYTTISTGNEIGRDT